MMAVLLNAVSGVTTREPVAAATTGAGFSGITPYGGYLGNYIAPNGTRVYCMDSGRDWPSGSTDGGALVGSLSTEWGAAISPGSLQRLNYALGTFGQTADPTQAAAVSAYVYAHTSNSARSGPARHIGAHYIDGNSAVLAAYNSIWDAVEANHAGPTTGSATLAISMANTRDGYVTVTTSPTTATGTLTLSGAVGSESGATTISVSHGQVVPIRGTPDDDATAYSISVAGNFVAPSGASPTVTVYTTGNQQRTLSAGTPSEIVFSASAATPSMDLRFAPIVRTQVASTFVSEGDAFVDALAASVADTSPLWRTLSTGAPVPVIATGTLFGPFTDRPVVSAVPPVGAPIVGSETVSLTGPGAYVSGGSFKAPASGFYTWVWSIDSAAQETTTRKHLVENYRFSDEFGLVAETHVVSLRLSVVSQASPAEVGYSGEVSDQLTVALDKGEWLTQAGSPVPAVFEGTAYFVAGDTAPAVSDVIPPEAVVLGTASVTATAPGTYPASTTVRAPSATAGFVSWVWRLSPTSATAGYFEPWADQFGLPAETTRVAPPVVTTQAVSASAVGDDVHDTAIVGGVVPAEPSYLVFEAYFRPSGAEVICDESTRVFETSAAPVTVTAVGNYDSPVTQFTEYGTYYWIESLYSFDHQLLHRGECGLPEETTIVAPGTVSTLAVQSTLPGAPAHDVATVEGSIPRGATLVFEAFVQTNPDGPVCTPSSREFVSEPVPVRGPGTYRSPSTTFEKEGTYFWVETLVDRNGETLHRGQCGAPGETTLVTTSSLASTGVTGQLVVLVGASLILVGILVTKLLSGRRTTRGR